MGATEKDLHRAGEIRRTEAVYYRAVWVTKAPVVIPGERVAANARAVRGVRSGSVRTTPGASKPSGARRNVELIRFRLVPV